MTDRPILFSAPMVRALLDGRKTQTRRILKPQPDDILEGQAPRQLRIAIGDRLWARETWQGLSFGDYQPTKSSICEVRYAATDPCADLDAEARGYPWRPSIFMPRWASRITLIVTDVRVERLQDISEKDAEAEGVEWETADPPFCYVPGIWPHDLTAVGVEQSSTPFSACYLKLWDYINGAGAASKNPWVAAYSFRVVKQNVDQIEPEAA
ncbi:hypothetical protein [Sinorhizobium alkalisoli]|uniref:hypothetical protein n=1 Tax=Sinorhizobium alkalisoli TaxID=1752398 RepID=UPI00124E6B62|nr:hypothetical protein [Sinorhizobium alkalisoli]QFI65747.1 Phage-related protein [Sinorhizobium alkalisoli]